MMENDKKPPSKGGFCEVSYRSDRIRTRDLRFWRPPLYQLSYTPTPPRSPACDPGDLLGLAVLSVLPAARTVLPQLQASRGVLLVLAGGVVPLLAVRARHPDDQSIVLSHNLPSLSF